MKTPAPAQALPKIALPPSVPAPATIAPPPAPQPDATRVARGVEDLQKAMKGWGTDEDAIYRVLENHTPAEVLAIEKKFTERYGREWGGSLESALRDEMSGSELERALKGLRTAHAAPPPAPPKPGPITAPPPAIDGGGALSREGGAGEGVSFSPAETAREAANLHKAMKGLGTNEQEIYRVLEQHTPAEVLAIEKDFNKIYGPEWGGSLRAALDDEMSGSELARALRALDSAKTPPPASGVRANLEAVLRDGDDDDVRDKIGPRELAAATAPERARLIEKLLDGTTGDDDEKKILDILRFSTKDAAPGVIESLTRSGRLDQLVADVHGKEFSELRDLMPKLAKTSESAAALIGALAKDGSSDDNKLGVHHILDAARAGGFLDATNSRLKRSHPADKMVMDCVAQSKPTVRPMIVAHRGGPANSEFPENTIGMMKDGLKAGAESLEIDLCVTKDGKIVLWHDYEPGGLVGTMRNLGLEPGSKFRPTWPNLGSANRKPIHELDLATVRKSVGYDGPNGPYGGEIPTFDQVIPLLKDNPQLKELVLDIKLPPGKPEVAARMAATLKKTLESNGIDPDRVVLIHNDAGVVKNLKKGMGAAYDVTHDTEIVSLLPDADDYSATRNAQATGSEWASVGRPRIGLNAYDEYMEVLRRDRKDVDKPGGPSKLMTWTINDELAMREIIAIGADGIMTDEPEKLKALIKTLGLDK